MITEVWRAPGLEIRLDVMDNGERVLRPDDRRKLLDWCMSTTVFVHPLHILRVGAWLAGEEIGEVES